MGRPEEPLLCSLSSDALAVRLAAWRALSDKALSEDTEPGAVITTYPDDPGTVEQLEALVEAERRCCPWLELDVRAGEGTVVLELRYPDG